MKDTLTYDPVDGYNVELEYVLKLLENEHEYTGPLNMFL